MIDSETIAAVRARVELDLACGQKDFVAAAPPIAWMPAPPRAAAARPPSALERDARPVGPYRRESSAARPPEREAARPRPPERGPAPGPAAGPAPPGTPSGAASGAAPPPPEGAPDDKRGRLEQRARELAPCTRCPLAKGRTQVVYGAGNPGARLMFVGEGPGADEDRLGEPFVGRAGQLLDRIIEAMSLRRDAVYIANVVKCRPPGNRAPVFEEVRACLPFLLEQIEIVKPEVLVALGATAARTLLDTQASMGSLRGRFLEFRGTPLICTYHPAYLLRNPADKRKVWEDMQMVMRRLGLEVRRP